ncbi:MAG: hypothetical protein KGP28_11615 [Bdellovibrionales bacterium]|nr:hypothetical protein [Bdellovibrionales bacterium]
MDFSLWMAQNQRQVKPYLRTCLAILLTFFSASPSYALIDVPTFRLGLGYAPLKFTAGTIFPDPTSLGNFLTVNPMFLWDLPSIRTRIGVNFVADLGSNYGFFSIAGVGLTALLYPLGLSSSREVGDDFSEVIKTRVSPFIAISVTPTKLSVSSTPDPADPDFNFPGRWPYFASKIIETSFGAGIDYPLGRDFVLFVSGHYRFAAWKTEEQGDGIVSYEGPQVLIGFSTNFY